MDEEKTLANENGRSKKSEWLWLLGLCFGGLIILYVVVKITRTLMAFAGLA